MIQPHIFSQRPYIYNKYNKKEVFIILNDMLDDTFNNLQNPDAPYLPTPDDMFTCAMLPIYHEYNLSFNGRTFVPIEILRDYFKDLKHNNIFKSESDEIDFYLGKIDDKKKILKYRYNGLPVFCLKKPCLDSEIIRSANMEESMDANHIISYDNNYRNGWLSNIDMNNILHRIKYFNKSINVQIYNTLYIRTNPNISEYENERNIYNYLQIQFNNHELKTEKDAIIIPLIFVTHFVVVIVNCKLKTVLFFDSMGYNRQQIRSNKNVKIYYLLTDLSLVRTSGIVSTNRSALYVNPFIDILNNQFVLLNNQNSINNQVNTLNNQVGTVNNQVGIKTVILNDFMLQKSKTECGPFVITFIMNYIINNPKSGSQITNVYDKTLTKGDFFMNFVRASMFFTKEDLNYYKMSANKYNNDLSILITRNKLYHEIFTEYNNKQSIFKGICERVSRCKKNIVANALDNLKIDENADLAKLLNNYKK